ncbi:hypothetical protein KBB12_02925 [Candidatus Woesebacteria bacterium]|nr:hypothetical protein [Candidatus Woesebacteria bacterium]
MRKHLLSVKHETRELELLKDLYLGSLDAVTKRGKNLAWLQFASRNPHGGYKFHSDTDAQWELLSQIVEAVARKYPAIRTGEITDTLSRLVNTTVLESLEEQQIKVKKTSLHLQTTLIHHAGHEIHIPRYPWIHGVEVLHAEKSLWKAHDNANNALLRVRKETQDEYTMFFLDYQK